MPRKRRESEIREGEIAIRDRKPSASIASLFRLDGFSASRGRGLAVLGHRGEGDRRSRRRETGHGRRGDGVARPGRRASAEAESRTHVHIRITDGIEGSQAGWSAAMADGLQLLGLNPLRGTIDGAQNFGGPVQSCHLRWAKTGPDDVWRGILETACCTLDSC